MSNRLYAIRARHVIPVTSPPIENGVVTIRDDRIVAVDRKPGSGVAPDMVFDLGDVALLPGFVNAHTHLEFSDLVAPLGTPGMSLPDWIRLVVAHRRNSSHDAESAVRAGMRESARYGVTAIGEIAQRNWSPAAIESLPLAVNVYLELIGLKECMSEELCTAGRTHAARTAPADARWQTGVSPHAPYTIHREVVRQVAGYPVAMHLAESREELELLATATGPMRKLLEGFAAWRDDAFGNLTPAEYVQTLTDPPIAAPQSIAVPQSTDEPPTALIVHGNYLDAASLDLIASAKRPTTVVYCPRTHAFFGHDPYPLVEFLRRGIPVAIGTDSRASNPDLSVLAELRFIAERYPEVSSEDVLRLGTIAGAKALGRQTECGSIELGKLADLAAVPIDAAAKLTPYEQVLRSPHDVLATIAAGKVVHDPLGLMNRLADG
jgi:cytosine/adenosine deaminase-related metal-dependent hydrolase